MLVIVNPFYVDFYEEIMFVKSLTSFASDFTTKNLKKGSVIADRIQNCYIEAALAYFSPMKIIIV